MTELLNDNAVDSMAKMLELIGNPDDHQTRFIMKTLPIIHFLESMHNPNLTLLPERDLLINLIETLPKKLADIEGSTAKYPPEGLSKNPSFPKK